MSINGTVINVVYNSDVRDVNNNITINFEVDGGFTGRNLCNYYGGKYTISNDTLKFSEVTMTLLLCPSDNDLMNEYEQIFRNPVIYRISGNYLTFFNIDGKELVKFKA